MEHRKRDQSLKLKINEGEFPLHDETESTKTKK